MYSMYKTLLGRVCRFSTSASIILLAVPMAFAQLERVGPISAATGYPAWYQDKTGLTLELCSPTNLAELQGGWCVLLPGDTVAPENIDIAGQFSEEHFYFLAGAAGTTINGGKAKLVLGLEGAFGGGPVLKGDQIVFARIRAVVTNLPAGDYKVYHPYGIIGPVHVDAGGKLFVTEDVGLTPGVFDTALGGKIGPFLLPSSVPGGAEIPAVLNPSTGRLYLADPARLGPITDSPVGQNYFRVVSVTQLGETDMLTAATGTGPVIDFNLAGRVFTGAIPGRVTVDRAVYSNDGNGRRVDVFASVFPTVQARVPGGPRPVEVTPQLDYYHGACNVNPTSGVLSAPTGQAFAPMRISGHTGWGQSSPATIAEPIPLQVCVEDRSSGTFYDANVTDDVKVAQALFDPASNLLTVNASSSDTDPKVQLALVYPGGTAPLANGSVTVPVAAPPSRIQVSSNHGGAGQARITAKPSAAPVLLTDIVTAQNLLATVQAGAQVVIPIPNAGSAGNTISIVSAPALGTAAAVFSPAGTTDAIAYTANAGTGGRTDTFTYLLTSGNGIVSNVASVTVTIVTPLPPPPPTGENIVVTSAQYRLGQARWTITGTDNLIAGQVLTLVNVGSTAAPKNVTLGSAVVPAGGAWTFDIRGVTGALIPAVGDQVIAVNASVTPNVRSQPFLVSVIK
jgi:hypothetical protein